MKYITTLEIHEKLLNGTFDSEFYDYQITTEELPTAENVIDVLYQAIEIEGIGEECYVMKIIEDDDGEYVDMDNFILIPEKIVYTDIPSKFVVWGNNIPHIFTIDRENSIISFDEAT